MSVFAGFKLFRRWRNEPAFEDVRFTAEHVIRVGPLHDWQRFKRSLYLSNHPSPVSIALESLRVEDNLRHHQQSIAREVRMVEFIGTPSSHAIDTPNLSPTLRLHSSCCNATLLLL